MRIFSGNIYCLYTYLPVIEDIRKAFHDSELRLDYSQNNIPESTEHRIYSSLIGNTPTPLLISNLLADSHSDYQVPSINHFSSISRNANSKIPNGGMHR